MPGGDPAPVRLPRLRRISPRSRSSALSLARNSPARSVWPRRIRERSNKARTRGMRTGPNSSNLEVHLMRVFVTGASASSAPHSFPSSWPPVTTSPRLPAQTPRPPRSPPPGRRCTAATSTTSAACGPAQPPRTGSSTWHSAASLPARPPGRPSCVPSKRWATRSLVQAGPSSSSPGCSASQQDGRRPNRTRSTLPPR
jgi:hypothetical protein